MMAAEDANIVVDAINEALALNRQLTAEQQVLYQMQVDAGQEAIDAAGKAGKAKEVIVKANQAAQLHTQAINAASAAAFGLNMDASNQVITEMGMRAMQSLGAVNSLTDEMQRRRSTTIRDDPMGYLYSSAILPDMAADLQGRLKEFQAIQQAMQQLNATVQTQINTNNALTAKVTGESAEAAAQLVAQETAIQVATIKRDNLKYGLDSLTAGLASNRAQLDGALQIYQVRNTEESMELQRKRFELDRQRFALEREKQLKDKTNETDIVNTINRGRARLGLPPLETQKALTMMRLPGELGETIRKQYELGARIDVTGSGQFGSDPGEAVIVINASNATLPAPQKQVQNFIESAINELRRDPLNKGLKPDELRAKLNQSLFGGVEGKKRVAGKLTQQAENIEPDNNANIYQAPPFGAMIQQTAVKNSNLYKIILESAATTGTISMTPDELVSKAVAAIKNRQITIEDAADGIATYYKAAVHINNITKRYEDFALPPQKNFNTTVPLKLPYHTQSVTSIDLTNPAQITNLLLQRNIALSIPAMPPFIGPPQ
jgi:hypothetical protein